MCDLDSKKARQFITNRLLCRAYEKIPTVRIFAFHGIVPYQGSFRSSKIVVIWLSW